MSHATLPSPSDNAHPTACENCATPLQGDYCHACGQSTHSPVRHVGHAVEEVFESFWHLDGRIFRTMRDLCVPGRIAERYLGGHRVRYVAPMRLLVIVTLLTIFVARFVVFDAVADFDVGQNVRTNGITEQFAAADSLEAVRSLRDDSLAGLEGARRTAGALPGVTPQLDQAEAEIREAARARAAQIAPNQADALDAPAADTAQARPMPPTIGGPAGEALEGRMSRISDDPRGLARALLGVAPTALFILVPLFAVLLKLLYLFQGRLYLEHVVVALYSHAALMMGLLAMLCCALTAPWLAAHAAWAAGPVRVLKWLVLAAMPVYLLLMQKRVYRQSWPWTLLKFAVIGQLYFGLFLSVAIPMAIYAISTF